MPPVRNTRFTKRSEVHHNPATDCFPLKLVWPHHAYGGRPLSELYDEPCKQPNSRTSANTVPPGVHVPLIPPHKPVVRQVTVGEPVYPLLHCAVQVCPAVRLVGQLKLPLGRLVAGAVRQTARTGNTRKQRHAANSIILSQIYHMGMGGFEGRVALVC